MVGSISWRQLARDMHVLPASMHGVGKSRACHPLSASIVDFEHLLQPQQCKQP